jgi:hypothetical protein
MVTVGELRKQGKSYSEIAKIGESSTKSSASTSQSSSNGRKLEGITIKPTMTAEEYKKQEEEKQKKLQSQPWVKQGEIFLDSNGRPYKEEVKDYTGKIISSRKLTPQMPNVSTPTTAYDEDKNKQEITITTDANANKIFGGGTSILNKQRISTTTTPSSGITGFSTPTTDYTGTMRQEQYLQSLTPAQRKREEQKAEVRERFSTKMTAAQAAQYREQVARGDIKSILPAIGLGAAAYIQQAAKSAAVTVADALNPKNTVELIRGLNEGTISGKTILSDISRRAGELGSAAQKGDVLSAGQLTGAIFGTVAMPSELGTIAKIAKGIGKATQEIKLIGKPKIEVKDYVDESVFKGTTFPKAKSTSATAKEIMDTETVITFSPKTIKPTTVGESSKSKLNLEDPGIYVAPKGRGNPYFTRAFQTEKTQYSLNPLKEIFSDIQKIKTSFDTPTVTQFKVTKVVEPPKSVLKTPGFGAVREFQENVLAGTGAVQITKRSKLGQGEIPRQQFYNPTSKRFEFEKGTTEIEAVIPKGSVIKSTPLKGYIEFQGKKINVREGILDITKELDNIKTARKSNIDELIQRSKKTSASDYKPNISYKSPRSVLSSLLTSNNSKLSSNISSKLGGSSIFSNIKGNSSVSSLRGGSSITGGGSSGGGGSSISSLTGGGSSGGGGSSISSLTGGGSSGGRIKGISSDLFRNPFKLKSIKEGDSTTQAYNVYAREQGRVFKLNKSPLPQNKAFNTGEYYINNTTARSFELRPTGKEARVPDENLRRNAEQYRERKTRTALKVVEKEKYAINTTGEKQGLSVAKLLKGNGGLRL